MEKEKNGIERKKKNVIINFEKAYTFFMVPFYYDGEWEDIHKWISRWEPKQEDLYKEDILYPYIMELFKKETDSSERKGTSPEQEGTPANRLKIYQLRTDDKGSASEFFFDRILGKRNVAILENTASGKNKPYPIPFKFLNEGNNAPHLFISPSAKIGIMTLCVELGNGCNVQDLQLFNYFLHKRNEISKVVIKKETLPNGKEKVKTETRTSNYRIVCPSPEKHKSLSDTEILDSVSQYLNPDSYKQLTTEVQNISNEHINWDLNYFVGSLLNTLRWNSQIKYFNKERIHIYTFCSIPEEELVKGKLSDDDLIIDAIRLSRVVNNKYQLPFDDMLQKGAVLQTYQNIYFASAIEGTAMMCIAQEINKDFIGNIPYTFNRQYMLVYLLVLLQRYTLLSIDRRLTEYDARNDDSDEELWNLINLICKIKVNCYYTDVSIYTHHSQFYQHCCRNLHIPDTFKEIDEKVELLKLTTDRRMQRIIEEQRKLQEEQAKRHQEEIAQALAREREAERIRKDEQEKEEKRLQLEKDESERRQHILNIIVAILTVAQVVQAVYELWSAEPKKDIIVPLSTGIVCLALLIWIGKKDLMKLWNKNN